MMYFSVSRAWLFSRTSQRVYLLCAILDLAFLGTQVGIATAMNLAGVYTLPPAARTVVGFLLLPEIVGTAVLAVGMTYCWLAVGGSCGRKLLWILFLDLFIFTMPIYYFAVYRRLASQQDDELATPALATS